MSKIFITGVNGFIGSHIAERFIQAGHQVCGLVRKTSDLKLIEHLGLELYYGDISEQHSFEDALQGVEMVVHVAGFASDWGEWEKFRRINIEGTQNVARAAQVKGVKRFVHISTVALHGFPNKRNMDESTPFAQTKFAYCESKKVAEQWLFDFAQKSPMEITAIRPGNVFGPRDHTFIEKYLEVIEQGKAAYIDGGRHWTCPVYIDNLVDGVMLAALSEQAPGQAFIITDGLDINWKTFTEKFAAALGAKRPRLSIPFGLGYALAFVMELLYKILRIKQAPLLTRYRISNGGRDYHFSIEKAKRMLGYEPKVPFDEAVLRTVDWFRKADR